MTYTEEEYNEAIRKFSAQIVEKDAAIAELTSERDGYKATIENFLASDDAKRAELVAEAVKTANEKRIAELAIEIAEDKAELERDQAELERLKPNG